MGKSNKILTIMIAAISVVAVIFASTFGFHYFLGNPLEIVLPADMNAFTVVNGGDFSNRELASMIRGMKRHELNYMQAADYCYCARGEGTYDFLNEMMAANGYEYIGRSSSDKNMRCFFKAEINKIRWVRVEYDIHGVWATWNLGALEEYDLAKDGYKTID
ncbi:MAG: hypothetical protein GX107_04365 [Clostridiales bacterium]|jgi:hypothetical protein|nr:hypothetical protein [Clostridiales bacterium]